MGREEFDDLEEYHRGLEEASTSEEDQFGADGDEEESGDAFGEECPRSSRSMSSSSISTSSASDDIKNATNTHCKGQEVTATSSALVAPAPIAPFSAFASTALARPAPITVGGGDCSLQVPQRARCSSSMSSCESDSDFVGVTAAALLEPPASEGMGFPYAEDLLGYEMQSWFCCQDEDDPQSMLQNQHPFGGRGTSVQQQQSHHYQPSAMAAGANLGWGGLSPTYSDGWGRSSSGSMSSSLSCDDEYVPTALPPLLGMSADP